MAIALTSRTSTSLNVISQQNRVYNKRQQPSESVVHVTVTAAGTVFYTYTATSYSYVPSYSTISTANPSTTNIASNNGNKSSTDDKGSSNIGAIIGGVVGGVALIALIALGFLFLRRRSQKKKREKQKSELIDDDNDSYYRGLTGHPLSSASVDHNNTIAGMTSLNSPAPRHLVAPQNMIEGTRGSKYLQSDGGYYEDLVAPYPKAAAYYSANNSVASDSLPSTAVDTTAGMVGHRNVPNEVDHSIEERHVPHLKENNSQEPPHAKD